ncbi:hypothetical protein ACFFGT_06780 [Mucilaginibacter angelicae]|uniref:Beta-carotene 15,15'-monooxygenase n=1 Tax=Mucilaginibacter angelicae TaxID=869718 RepID=A0ABV6L2J6_9SPHI
MEQLKTGKQPWVKNGLTDGIFILSPPFIALFIVALFPAQFKNSVLMPVQYWVVLIVMIDVAHVYSTLYRTYFNPPEFKKQPHVLIAVPLFCYIGGVMLYLAGGIFFWRVLAYLAVYHFIRQQYGFLRIYSRRENQIPLFKYIDNTAIYIATIYPLLYWHFAGSKKNFNWFVDGDFVLFHFDGLLIAAKIIYLVTIALFAIKEAWLYIKTQQFNLPKNLVVLGTFLSWYFGIVYYNGDMAFTTLNVVSHGIPYMALVWFYEQKKFTGWKSYRTRFMKLTFSRYGVLSFVGLLILFAYVEEGLWDGLIWKEHVSVFRIFATLPSINSDMLLALTVPLLALPQSTHYVLDGFIWRMQKQKQAEGPVTTDIAA